MLFKYADYGNDYVVDAECCIESSVKLVNCVRPMNCSDESDIIDQNFLQKASVRSMKSSNKDLVYENSFM